MADSVPQVNTHTTPASQAADDHAKDICVIGTGPAGLAALKVIVDHPAYKAGLWHPTAYEAREDVGGIWLPATREADPPLTPVYDSLTTIIPHPAMAYASYPFPPETPLYPPASTVAKYLKDYASHFQLYPHIQFNARVQSVKWLADKKRWEVKAGGDPDSPSAAEFVTKEFDLVIVANGQYRKPRYPSTPGLSAWREAGHVTHSAYFRNASHPYITKSRTILVVGGGPSGRDITAAALSLPDKVVIHSSSGATNEDLDGGRYKLRPRIKEFLPYDEVHGGSVVFEDGTTESGITHCMIATGYETSYPFLEPGSSDNPPLVVGIPPAIPPFPPKVYNSTYHVFPLAKLLFPLTSSPEYPPSSLAFLGIPFRVVPNLSKPGTSVDSFNFRVVPFPMAEVQTRVILKVFENPSSLDIEKEKEFMISQYKRIRASIPPTYPYDIDTAMARLWHVLDEDEQFDYRDELHAFVGGEYAKPEWKVPKWIREVYVHKVPLRVEWKELEKTGEAQEWLKGVGEGKTATPDEEWYALIKRVLESAQRRRLGNLPPS
ncbi:FAD/NAD(P)-binding domain-containing protein [Panus rudis PR-1116 ss-1]|nr:FAD/NAD(P)-binding domain-containing protein [Panus rudis PR-1116 ss-1]